MLTAASAWARRVAAVDPWTTVYGLARTLLATGTLLTLVFNDEADLFPVRSSESGGPFCKALGEYSAFCVLGETPGRIAAITVLLVVAVGWRPRWTAIPHWYITFSVASSIHTVEGGDHLASILTLLIVPVALADRRRWHWSPPELTSTDRPGQAFTAHSGLLVIRVQMAIVYLHASIGKLGVTEWREGTALYYWLSGDTFGIAQWARPLMMPVLEQSWGVAALTWGTVALEFALALGLFAGRRVRRIMLVCGLVLHASIAALMGLVTFGLAMAGGLVLYLYRADEPLVWWRPDRTRGQTPLIHGGQQ